MGYDTTRPISCYTGSLTSKISGDVSLEESLVTCSYEKDVCFGKVVLTVSNDTDKSDGYIQVEKGCGLKAQINAEYSDRGKFNSGRSCYVTDVKETNQVIDNSFSGSANSSETLLSTQTKASTVTSVNEEICFCEGSRCNEGTRKYYGIYLIASLVCLNLIRENLQE